MTIPAILKDPDYAGLKREIVEYTGLNYFQDKDEDLAARLGRRLTASGSATLAEYRRRLAERREMESLIGELTIGETYFFRQREHFEFLRDRIFPDLFERNRERRSIRIWSAGCATGAEPYSVAMLLRLELSARAEGWDISILATDINTEFLQRARDARYDNWAFRETPDGTRDRCFRRVGNRWELRPEFRRNVTFEYHNLATGSCSPHGERFDLIICRNVTIYFGRDTIRRVAGHFYEALVDEGWLLVGHAEPNAETFARFATVTGSGTTAYRRSPPDRLQPTWPPTVVPSPPAPIRSAANVPARRAAPRPARAPVAISSPAPTLDVARAMADRGEWDAAADHCRRLIAADPLNPAAHFTLGLILEHRRALDEAENSLRRAVYLDRGFALAHYHLGTCLQPKSPAGARKSFENVLQLLQGKPDAEVLSHGDGITALELRDMARMHLEVLGSR